MSTNIQQRKQWFQGKVKKLIKVMVAFSVLMAIFMTVNIVRIYLNKTGSGSTLSDTNVSSKYKNEYYKIGNNPTSINEKYFKELTSAVKDKDDKGIAEGIVKCFVSEYYTWTNKDGTYDIGGMQYIYSPRLTDFEKYTREEVYVDMDLYLSQLGRDKLMQVKEVTVSDAAKQDNFTVLDSDGNEVSLEAYHIKATWSYESGTEMNLSEAVTSQDFIVVNNNGRMEIASMA